ncbi:MAG TPA: BTAD domain-containing putative transcriptional regulator [Pseudonocardiaceae bacterium]
MYDIGLLGPVRLTWSGRELPLGGCLPRTVLATCALEAGCVVSADTLAGRLWGARPPRTATAQIHNQISRLRRRAMVAGAEELLRTIVGGYVLAVQPERVDVHRFSCHVEQARAAARAQDHDLAVTHFSTALAMWRGNPLGGTSPELAGRALHLTQLRAAVREERIDVLARRHGPERVVAELEHLVLDQPDRESAHAMLMAALFLTGRRGDALLHYRNAFRRSVDELGVEPGGSLRRLHERCLAGDTNAVAASVQGWAEVAPVRPAAPRPATARRVVRALPPPGPALAGRSGELNWLIGRLLEGRGRPIVVCGMPGVGKTGLTVRAAHRVSDDFPDGQLYANLDGGGDPSQVLRGFLRALRPDRVPPPLLADRVCEYRTETADRRLLVVLDGVGRSAQVRHLLPAGPGSAVVLTSRRRLLGLGPVDRLCLRPLDEAGGAAVLATEPAVDRSGVAEISALCGGLPLALSIVATRLAAAGARGSADLIEALARAPLSVLESEDVSVAAAIGSAVDELGAPARALLRRIAAGPPPAVEECGKPLDELLDVHLVEEFGTNRAVLRCHPLVARYVEPARAGVGAGG